LFFLERDYHALLSKLLLSQVKEIMMKVQNSIAKVYYAFLMNVIVIIKCLFT